MTRHQSSPAAAAPVNPPPFWQYALSDWLEMRAGMHCEERSRLIQLIEKNLSPSGAVSQLPALILGNQAVLFPEENPLNRCWVFHRESGELKNYRDFF